MAKAPTHHAKDEAKRPGEIALVDDLAAAIAATPPPVQPICATCAGWAALSNDPIIGYCLPSRKALPAPLVTLNMGTCSRWAPIK